MDETADRLVNRTKEHSTRPRFAAHTHRRRRQKGGKGRGRGQRGAMRAEGQSCEQ